MPDVRRFRRPEDGDRKNCIAVHCDSEIYNRESTFLIE